MDNKCQQAYDAAVALFPFQTQYHAGVEHGVAAKMLELECEEERRRVMKRMLEIECAVAAFRLAAMPPYKRLIPKRKIYLLRSSFSSSSSH